MVDQNGIESWGRLVTNWKVSNSGNDNSSTNLEEAVPCVEVRQRLGLYVVHVVAIRAVRGGAVVPTLGFETASDLLSEG